MDVKIYMQGTRHLAGDAAAKSCWTSFWIVPATAVMIGR